MKAALLSRPQTCAHEWLRKVICSGDTVIDATVGHGYDTVFLARLVGAGGIVHAFDIQEEALCAAKTRLRSEGVDESRVVFHAVSHSRLAEIVACPVKATVFNLGFLPGGDANIMTQPETTLAALKQAAKLTSPNGLISVMCYPGHRGGEIETEEVERYLAGLPHHIWRTAKYQLLNTAAPAPCQFCAFRLK